MPLPQVHLHLDRVMQERRADEQRGLAWREAHFSPARMKLFSALQKSNSFKPEDVLAALPRDAFHSERALLLGKLDRHAAVLALLARKVQTVYICPALASKSLTKPSLPHSDTLPC